MMVLEILEQGMALVVRYKEFSPEFDCVICLDTYSAAGASAAQCSAHFMKSFFGQGVQSGTPDRTWDCARSVPVQTSNCTASSVRNLFLL